VSLDSLAAITVLANLHAVHSTDAYILGPDNTVLYHSDPAHVGQRFDDIRLHARTFEHTDAQGRNAVAAQASVPAADWTLVQEERWQETLSPVMRYSQAAPLALVPGLLLAMAAMWFGIQRIVYPLRRLETQATKLAWGDFAAIDRHVGGIEEIRRLQATMQHMAQRVQTAQATMHNYIGVITHAQEDERRRLARELHDQTSQSLVALGHRQQMLKPYLTDDPAALELHAEIRRMIQETVEDLRRIVRALRPIYLEELGLAPALQMLARDLGLDDRITVHFEKTGTPQRLTPEHEMVLYRIAQEALNNAWQHSGASQLWLTVRFAETHVLVSVRDNGRGFAAPRHAAELSVPGQKHFGLLGMYERAALIGAFLQVQSEPGAGTTVTVRMIHETSISPGQT
jgi:signal transduction histidine kinase